mgnify:CR=1 FL=1
MGFTPSNTARSDRNSRSTPGWDAKRTQQRRGTNTSHIRHRTNEEEENKRRQQLWAVHQGGRLWEQLMGASPSADVHDARVAPKRNTLARAPEVDTIETLSNPSAVVPRASLRSSPADIAAEQVFVCVRVRECTVVSL